MAARRGLIAAALGALALGCGAAAVPAETTAAPVEPLTPPCRLEAEELDVSVISPELARALVAEGSTRIEVDRVLRIASCGAMPELLVVELRSHHEGDGTATAAILERASLARIFSLAADSTPVNACFEDGSSARLEPDLFRDTCRGGARELWLEAQLHDEYGCPSADTTYAVVCSADQGLQCVAMRTRARTYDGSDGGAGAETTLGLRVEPAGDCRVRLIGEGGRTVDLREALTTGGILPD